MSGRSKRVVVTGLGVVSPNATNVREFDAALQAGRSGIAFIPELRELDFGCQVGGEPPLTSEQRQEVQKKYRLVKLKNNGVLYGVMAGMEAWEHSGLPQAAKDEPPLFNMGCVFGAGALGVDIYDYAVPQVRSGNVKRQGSRLVLEAMNSATASFLTQHIGFGNWVGSNSSACSTGTEALALAYRHIQDGRADVMLAGSCETDGPIIWSVFDSLRALQRSYNDTPEQASRPLSATARGFVPGAGAGALVLEDYEHAMERGAEIYAEIVGASVNSGGQRQGGSKTRPNQRSIIRCIHETLDQAEVRPGQIDLISGHLTATMADPIEVASWAQALELSKEEFPLINSVKSMIGHCIGAAGAIESVASVLQMKNGYVHPSINAEDLHPKILEHLTEEKVPQGFLERDLEYVVKANFGFGDVNACVLFKSFD